MVKENRDKLQENTEILKETFSDKFNIIENYEKSIVLYRKEKTDIIEANDEIYQLKKKEGRRRKNKKRKRRRRNKKKRRRKKKNGK